MAYASAPRSSSRAVKPRSDPDFIYGEEVKFLSRSKRVEVGHTTQSLSSDSPVFTTGKNTVDSCNWRDIGFISNINSEINNKAEFSRHVVPVNSLGCDSSPENVKKKNGEVAREFVNNTGNF